MMNKTYIFLLCLFVFASCQKDEKRTVNQVKTETPTYEMTGILIPEDVKSYLQNKVSHMALPTTENFKTTWKDGLPDKAANPFYFTGDFDSNKNKDYAVLMLDGDQSKVVVVHDMKGTLTHRFVCDGPQVVNGKVQGAVYPRFDKKIKVGPSTTELNTDAIEVKIGENKPVVYFWNGIKYAPIGK